MCSFSLLKLTLILFIIYHFKTVLCIPQCINEYDEPVDWFVLYKLPKIPKHSHVNVTKGISYLYITSENVKQGWKFSDYAVTDPKSIPGKTLAVTFAESTHNEVDDIFYLLYNDQPPNQPYSIEKGHTKGIIVGNQNGGFWMVHSVPKFPIINKQEGYQYPPSGKIYGQSFLCITMKPEELNNVGNQVMINNANVYDGYFSDKMKIKYPTLFKASQEQRTDVQKNKELFLSANNEQFTSFAKSGNFGADLYSKWVADVLQCELFVESWLHEHKSPSVCNKTFETHNVQKIVMNRTNVEFGNLNDHSKWAVSAQASNPWICVGDINRATSQFTRAGGTVCIKNIDLWSAYFKIVAAVEPCPKMKF